MANDSYTMECRIFFLVILLLGINKIEGKSEVRSSLTFVIDDTGSMGDDIAQVKQGVNKIFDTVMKSKSSQIEDFVLVTFNDPGVQLRTITKDREVFRQALTDIDVDGGDDCPENALTGIELALKRSRDSSLLYVFTDASAKDYKIFARVEALSQKKQSQIVFVLTGVCDSRYTADYLVYHKLAKATSGQVFHLGKTDIGKILKYVTTTIESRKNVIASKSYAPGYGNSFDVEVDGATKELVISVSGLNPSVEVTDSSGSTVPTEDITRLAEVAVVKVITVKPDTYKVEVGSKSGTHVIVSGTSSVHFQHGFSVLKPTSIDDTASRPVPGQKSHLSIKLSTEGGNVELKTVQILDMDDRVVLEKPLKLVDRKEEFYTTEPIDAPDHMFKIAIKGYDKESKTFLTRISLTPIKPQDPTLTASTPYQAPIVTLEEEEIDAEYDEPLQIKCKVSGYPKPNILWETDDPTEETTQTDSTIELPSKFVSVLEIRKVNKNATYTCRANNIKGTVTKSVVVKTKRKNYFTVLELPKDTTIEYAKEGQIHCKVDAFPPASFYWYKNMKPLTPDGNLELSADSSILYIHSMEPDVVDNYICEARNDLERKVAPFKVSISGIEKPKIDKTINYVTTMRHSSVDIHCNLTNGKPKPTFTWLYTDQYSSTFIKLDDTSDTLHVKNVASDDTATYRCIAKNVVGEDYHDIYLIVEYPPVVTKTVSPSVVKNDGETVTLECPVDGGPTPDVVWRLNGREIRSSTRHRIFRDHSIRFTATLSDRGNYECEARNDHGVAHVKTTVEVIVPVNIEPPKRGTIEVMVGNRTVLPCRADGFPKPVLSWVFHSKDPKIPPRTFAPSDSTGSFDIPRIQLVQDGFYTCLAKNAGGSQNITYEVIVLAPPSITYTRKQFRAVLDDMVLRVPCKVSGNPKPEIMWMKKGFPIPAGSEWFDFAEDGSLIIKNVDELSAGNYLCHAENKVGVDYEGFDVIVEPTAYAELGYPAKTLLLKEGEPASVSCNVPHEKTDRLRWFKDGRVIAKGELEFARITSRDAGVYTCRVSSFFGAKTGTTKVVVGSKPEFIDNDEKNTILEFVDGSSGVMDCSTRGELVPEIKWYHDGKTMEFNQLTYYFEMNSPSVKGKYTCVVSNEFGSAQREFVVKSLGCALDINNDFNGNAPLMLTPLFELPKFEVTEGHVNIPREENIVLYCPTGFHKLPKKQIMVTCENDKEFSYEGIKHLYTDFKCRDKIEVKIEIAKSRCNAGNGQLMNIGFKTVTNFIKVYQLCFDPIYGKTLYSKLDMQPTLANVLPNYGFNNESFPKLETIYDCNYQNNEISAILGFNFHTDGRCCFAKRQLVSPKDVAPGLSQITTFTSKNVVPHWSTCNSKNWDDVEERIRMLVVSAYHELQVWTGIAEDLQMRDIDDAQKKITLPYRKTAQSVPTYLWKVVQDPASKASLAIIQVNVPDLMLLETRKYRVCNDVCGDVDWMQSSRWRNVDRGFTYCCQLSDFQRAFRSSALPSFPPYTKLLKNVAFVSEHYLHV